MAVLWGDGATVDVEAPPDRVWSLVSDVTRMGEWSPVCHRCEWVGGATGPAVGARFVGHNKANGARWSRECEITTSEPGREFAFQTFFRGQVSTRWRYVFTATATGTRVDESMEVALVPRWVRAMRSIPALARRSDRDAKRNIETSLARLKQERSVLDDLAAEEAELYAVLESLDESAWDLATPAADWKVRDQVAHLAQGEELAALAVTNPAGFTARLAHLLADLDAVAAETTRAAAASTPAALLVRWGLAAVRVVDAFRAHPDDERIAWVTGTMSPKSFATARLMETFAHGQDVYDAVGVERVPTDRVRHVADLGVRTRPFSFKNRGLDVPAVEPFVALTGPSGAEWTWGSTAATERVEGPALDFACIVTQRRNVADTALVVTGAGATEWLAIAQCFAGPPTDGPLPAK